MEKIEEMKEMNDTQQRFLVRNDGMVRVDLPDYLIKAYLGRIALYAKTSKVYPKEIVEAIKQLWANKVHIFSWEDGEFEGGAEYGFNPHITLMCATTGKEKLVKAIMEEYDEKHRIWDVYVIERRKVL